MVKLLQRARLLGRGREPAAAPIRGRFLLRGVRSENGVHVVPAIRPHQILRRPQRGPYPTSSPTRTPP